MNDPSDVSSNGRYVLAEDSQPGQTLLYRRDLGTAALAPTLSIGDVTVTEGDDAKAPAIFNVRLSRPAAVPVTVQYATQLGTAAATDIARPAGTLTFAAGKTSAAVKVNVNGDVADEADETFSVVLSSPTIARLHRASGTGTVVDDDPGAGLAVVSVQSVLLTEGDEGQSTAEVIVRLSRPEAGDVSVPWQANPGTATSPSDFKSKTGTLVIRAGSRSSAISIPVKGDGVVEPTEQFTVKLLGATGATLGNSIATITILTDDS